MDGETQPADAPKGARGTYVIIVFFASLAFAGVVLWQVAIAQRGKNPPLTLQRLDDAQQQWKNNRPENYSVQIKLFGQFGGQLTVVVNGPDVQLVADPPKLLDSASPDFWNPNSWTVDGMFVRLRRDLDIVVNPEFLPPAGTAAPAHGFKTLRADFDSKLGYIVQYKRPQLGQLPALQWRVATFEPRSGP